MLFLKKSLVTTMWKNDGFFQGDYGNFKLEKTNLPENTFFYVNQGYLSYKDSKKYYYNDIYVIAQIMPLANQPKDVESYECRDDEVKILRTLYDRDSRKFLGLEYCTALIPVRDDPDEQFFDYGYLKSESKNLYFTLKSKIPSSFKTTCFGFLKNQLKVECSLNKIGQRSFSIYPLPLTDAKKSINIWPLLT